MREASKKLGDEKLQKMLASMPHKQLDFKLAEVATGVQTSCWHGQETCRVREK